MTRVISALILGPAVLLVITYAPPLYFLIGLGAVGTLCLYEYLRLVRNMGLTGQAWFGYAAFWALLGGMYLKWFPVAALLSAVLVAGFMAAMWRKSPLKERALGLMANMLGVVYLSFLLYPAIALRFDFGEALGLHWVFLLFAVVWVGDSMALVIGKTLGRTPFASSISPKKTNEGAIGGLVAGVAAGVLLQQFVLTDLPSGHVIAVAFLAGAFGQLGDLAESMLKRAAEVKDSSGIIPGHGGVLDRIDSLLFAFPVAYLYLLVVYT